MAGRLTKNLQEKAPTVFEESGDYLYFLLTSMLFKNGGSMNKIKIIIACALLSGCIAGDCTSRCYIWGNQDMELLHKCNMDPLRSDCPVQR